MATLNAGMRSRLANEIYTYCAFWVALSALPALTLSYIGKIFIMAARLRFLLWINDVKDTNGKPFEYQKIYYLRN
jgi:hypothetical protein